MRVTSKAIRHRYAALVETLARQLELKCERQDESPAPYCQARVRLTLSYGPSFVHVTFDGADQLDHCILVFQHIGDERTFSDSLGWSVNSFHGQRATTYARDIGGVIRELREKFTAIQAGSAFSKVSPGLVIIDA